MPRRLARRSLPRRSTRRAATARAARPPWRRARDRPAGRRRAETRSRRQKMPARFRDSRGSWDRLQATGYREQAPVIYGGVRLPFRWPVVGSRQAVLSQGLRQLRLGDVAEDPLVNPLGEGAAILGGSEARSVNRVGEER